MGISEEKYKELLDFIHGELSESDAKKVELWINIDDENRQAYERILKDYMFVKFYNRSILIDKDNSYKSINGKLNKPVRKLHWYSVAASIIILLGISSLLIYDTISFKDDRSIVAPTKILPGKKKAVLYLSSGKKINISNENSTLKDVKGIDIKIDSLKGISYITNKEVKEANLIYNRVVVPRGGEYMATLADGTKVWLNSDSELRYPVDFTGDNRMVFLKGEAYFDVTKDKNKPFIVSIDDFRLKVFGTQFNVNSYDKDEIETVLVEGSVGLKKKGDAKENMLEPGQLGCMNINSGKVEIKNVDVNNYIAWKHGEFVFVNESLESIMEKLARWYDLEVFFQNEDCKHVMFSGNMRKYNNPEEFLFFIEKSSDVKFRVKGKTVILYSK